MIDTLEREALAGLAIMRLIELHRGTGAADLHTGTATAQDDVAGHRVPRCRAPRGPGRRCSQSGADARALFRPLTTMPSPQKISHSPRSSPGAVNDALLDAVGVRGGVRGRVPAVGDTVLDLDVDTSVKDAAFPRMPT